MDNQWGFANDHTIPGSGLSAEALYLATLPRGNRQVISQLQSARDWNRAHNSVASFTEFELVRQWRMDQDFPLRDDQYDNAIVDAAVAQDRRWRQEQASGRFNRQEFTRGNAHLLEMFAEIQRSDPANGRQRVQEIDRRVRAGVAAPQPAN